MLVKNGVCVACKPAVSGGNQEMPAPQHAAQQILTRNKFEQADIST
jgi:hypothetical protein